jgi:predicted phosphodiesterase
MSSRHTVAEKYGMGERIAGYYWWLVQNIDYVSNMFETDKSLVEQNVRYQKQKQHMMDINRIERKSFREYARVENAVSEYAKELMRIFDDNPYKVETVYHDVVGDAVGVIQLSDTHFNELINIKGNKYDFTVASQRIHKLVSEAINYFNLYNVSDVFVFLGGDLMNSDRRLDELVSMATNRSKATFISVQILEHAILHLNTHFNVHVAGINGNESRVTGKEYNWSNELVSDNYDFTIFNVLRYKLKDSDGISFLGLCDKYEEVVDVNGKNFLLVHGHQIGKDISKDISKLIRKYAVKDIAIDFVIWGHIHEAMIADMYARNSSVCGSNNYSEDALLLVSRASQNLHIVFDGDRIDSIKVDLQDVSGIEPYPTQDWIDAYNPKSVDKAHKQETILRITI